MQSELNLEGKSRESVTCLGAAFNSDVERRSKYLQELDQWLRSPNARGTSGFPRGDDSAILNLSDPPYYTACPNPFLASLVGPIGAGNQDETVQSPFAADVSEGRSGLFYDAHSYITKVPHKAIMRFLLHYTKPGDVVLDSYCGTGMTGVAAQMCGDREQVQSLGYRVSDDGTVYRRPNEDGDDWEPFSALGVRRAVLNDLSPSATFIASRFNTPTSASRFRTEAKLMLDRVIRLYGWMYSTRHSKDVEGAINYIIWSDIFTCSQCQGEINFWDSAVDLEEGQVSQEFSCPKCLVVTSKSHLERATVTVFDPVLNKPVVLAKQVPVLINYTVQGVRYEKRPDEQDLDVIRRISELPLPPNVPNHALPDGVNTRQPLGSHGVTHVHHFYTCRNLHILAALRMECSKSSLSRELSFLINSYDLSHSTLMSRVIFKKGTKPTLTSNLSGTLYISSLPVEKNILNGILKQKLNTIVAAFEKINAAQYITTGDAADIGLPDSCIDYVFIDPPFGGNKMYSELNFIPEAWDGLFTNPGPEAIENIVQGKNLHDYRRLMKAGFREAFRLLKPGRWMTVEFSNTQASVWNSIQTALQEAGFVVANVSALNKQQGSFKAVTTTTAVKQDLVISAYKPLLEISQSKIIPNVNLKLWEFIADHLKYVPMPRSVNGVLENILERDIRILYDRTIAWFVLNGVPIPLSTQEFQRELIARYPIRDTMVFLPSQVHLYDHIRNTAEHHVQGELFIEDETSAILWLQNYLTKTPSTYQELHGEFTSRLIARWKHGQAPIDLHKLLSENFLQVHDGEIPISEELVGSHGSAAEFNSHQESSDRPHMTAGTWYVPNPSKQADLEKLRSQSLIREFEAYDRSPGQKIRNFRLEALRVGFSNAWSRRDFSLILRTAKRLPEDVIEQDEILVFFYDNAMAQNAAL